MSIRREDLLGYLIGALEPHEMDAVEDELERDPRLRDQRDQLTGTLDRIAGDDDSAINHPPAGLIDRTLDRIDREATSESTSPTPVDLPPDTRVRLSPVASWTARANSPWDVMVLASVAVVVLAIAVPALLRARDSQRRTACADGLRRLGAAITGFAMADPAGRIPALSSEGREAFAGMYAIRLHDAGRITDPSVRWCPSEPEPSPSAWQYIDPFRLVAASKLQRAAPAELSEIRRTAGGHYAYVLGYGSAERHAAPRHESRPDFALLADWTPDRQHSPHGETINVLYEDESVRSISLGSLDALPDHPFRNHAGLPESGTTIDDAVLGPSWRPPFRASIQR